jgi:hypothetical protein
MITVYFALLGMKKKLVKNVSKAIMLIRINARNVLLTA